jgi:hypothetical protein
VQYLLISCSPAVSLTAIWDACYSVVWMHGSRTRSRGLSV